MMNLNLNSILLSVKNLYIICSHNVLGDIKYGLRSGYFFLVISALAIALALICGLLNDEDIFSFSATRLISSLFSFVFPCLICNPFNARL